MKIQFFVLAIFLLSTLALGEINRLYIVSQYDWGAKTGFYIDFENSSEGSSPCRLDNLHLILGIADGKNWRFIVASPKWKLDEVYKSKAIVTTQKGELYLDGELVGRSEGSFQPHRGDLTLYHIPGWAKGKADYLIIVEKIKLSAGKRTRTFTFPQRPLPLFIFEPQLPQIIPWTTSDSIEIEITFRIIAYPDLKKLAPFIDRYGQCKYADWKEKIKSDEDLKKAWEEEKRWLASLSEPKGYDRFGGYELAGWKEKGTGFYRVIKKNNYWWLITPEGNPCFYIGLCGVPTLNWEMTPVSDREYLFEWLPPKDGIYSACWARGAWGTSQADEYVAFHTANMIRKYGENWREIAIELTRKRLKLWGFSGVGKWGELEGLPFLPVLYRWDVPNVARHPDIFDPEIREKFRESLRRQIEPRKDDPFVVGWSLGNEYDEIISREEIREILRKPANIPAKRALIDYAIENIYKGDWKSLANAWKLDAENKEEIYGKHPNLPDEDLEKLRLFYAERYYEFIYRTVKEIDPNHLYFGFWIVPGWWESEEDWRVSAKYCDVIGYDLYSFEFMSDWIKRLVEETGKPIICGEFSYPAFYNGERGFGLYGVWAKDDAHSGELYSKWLKDASQNPYCLGVAWFFYRDQPLTGRGPGRGEDLIYGEHYAFGMVDMGDKPKWELVKRVRETNLMAIKLRLEASK
ncbi:glycosyl hydrolase [bacterium]|nr:glycosyl hydrolase [bacterium]